MNNDRELLELAAKAAGFLNWTERTNGLFIETGSFRGSSGYMWNPLTDDGDALRLAVKLGLHIDPEDDCVDVWDGATNLCDTQYFNDDPYAATRRAIVRAAAEIGKTL